jgi:hypothetical protein
MSSFYDDASWLLIPSGIKEDIVFAQKPTSGLGDLTFTRASDATYTDSTGVVRRSPYNLLTFSEMFSDGVYTKVATTITANTIVAPNGTLTADKLVSTSASSSHSVYQNLGNIGDVRTISCFVKKAEYRYVNLQYGTAVTRFDFDTLTFSGGTGNSYIDAGDGWYRISSILTATVNARASIAIPDNSGNVSYVGDNVSGTFIWGFQAVEGTSALDYFPTTNRQDVPRIDFRNADGTFSSCGRLLLEPQRTNSIRNSTMVGAVAGSPGTIPTNWGGGSGGLTRTVVGLGTENGLSYIDVRFNGTANSTVATFTFETNGGITASVGQVWSNNVYVKNIDTTAQANQVLLTTYEFNLIGTYLAEGSVNIRSQLTTSLKRFDFVRTLTSATVARVQPLLQFILTNGATYDFTIRIAAPQMELGAYATTFIPTTTAAVTRLADTASKTGVSSLIGQTEGTLFVDCVPPNGVSGRIFAITDASLNNRIAINYNTNNRIDIIIRTYNVITNGTISASASTQLNPGVINKIAFAYKSDEFALYINGSLAGTATGVFSVTAALQQIGASELAFLGTQFMQWNQAALFPTRLTNAQLAEITTL